MTDSDAARTRRNTPPHTPRPWPLPVTQSPSITRLTEALANSSPAQGDALLDEFMEDLHRVGTPLIEQADDPSHRIATFVYRGAAANRVYLQANKLTDAFTPAEGKLTPIPGTDVATLSLRMPADWICSYFFLTPPEPLDNSGGRLSVREVLKQRDALQPDPLNPRTVPHKLFPESGQSLVVLDDAPPEPVSVTSIFREQRANVTLPASGITVEAVIRSHPDADAKSPAILLCDGETWLGQTILAESLCAFIERGECPPLHLVYLPSGGQLARQLDYTAEADAQAELLGSARDAIRAAQPEWDARWIVAGQSLGGLFALLAAVRFPDAVSGAVAQSPSLWWPSGDALDVRAGAWFSELGEVGDSAPCIIQGGRTEWVLIRSVQHAREFLRGLGKLVETPHDIVTGGHDEAWWRRTLPEAIATMARFDATSNSHLG